MTCPCTVSPEHHWRGLTGRCPREASRGERAAQRGDFGDRAATMVTATGVERPPEEAAAGRAQQAPGFPDGLPVSRPYVPAAVASMRAG